jgi:hypothetical protein
MAEPFISIFNTLFPSSLCAKLKTKREINIQEALKVQISMHNFCLVKPASLGAMAYSD